MCAAMLTACEQEQKPVDPLDTAHELDVRTIGLATEWPTVFGPDHPEELIAIDFPANQRTPGFLCWCGEGTVTETKWSQLEKDILFEINKFRQDPVAWCKENGLPMLDGLTAEVEFSTGPRAGSYNFPARTLNPSQGLHKAALHQTARGVAAHSDASRVKGYVSYSAWGENVSTYEAAINGGSGATSDAAKIVAAFIRDGGIADKGHRINIANPNWDCAAIGAYKNIVVMQFGSNVKDVADINNGKNCTRCN